MKVHRGDGTGPYSLREIIDRRHKTGKEIRVHRLVPGSRIYANPCLVNHKKIVYRQVSPKTLIFTFLPAKDSVVKNISFGGWIKELRRIC